MAATSSLLPSFTFTNASTTTAATSCAPCSWLMIEPGYATWSPANSSLPALRTTQLYVDPNYNTTSTSVSCNTAALSAYEPADYYWANDDCELVAKYLAFAVGTEWFWETVTLTETTGSSLRVGGLMSAGPITTTNDDGQSTCLGAWASRFPTMMTYTDPITETISGSGTFWLMPDLTKYFPGVAAVEQCTLIMPGGSPVALTPANEIKLPVLTLDYTRTSSTSTPKTSSSSTSERTTSGETTTARPGGGTNTALPTRTSTTQTTPTSSISTEDSPPSSGPQPTNAQPSPSNNPPDQPQESQESDRDPPASTRPDDSPPNSTPDQPRPSNNPAEPSQGNQDNETDSPTTTRVSASSPGSPDPPNQSAENSPSPSDGPSTVPSINLPRPSAAISNDGNEDNGEPSGTNQGQTTAGNPAQQSDSDPTATDSPSNDSPINPAGQNGAGSSSNAVQPGTPADTTQANAGAVQPTDAGASSRIIPVISTDQPVVFLPDSGSGVVVGASTIISAGGQPAAAAGTTFSVLPSSHGVVAIANGVSSTLAAASFSPVVGGVAIAPVGVDSSNPPGYIVDELQITAGGAAATISGTTFSALPSGSGVLVVADGSSETLTGSSLAEYGIGASSEGATEYRLPGQTLTPGGSAATIQGTIFSALPTGSGVLIVADGQSQIVTGSSLSDYGIATSPSVAAGYQVEDQTLTPGGAAATIQGLTYSALPGSSGILVEADGLTTTLDASEATRIASPSSINAVQSISNGYVLEGSLTLTVSGSATTISGTVYSALPSGAGVLAVAVPDDEDQFAPFIEQGISGESNDDREAERYVIGGNVTVTVGESAVTVAGTVYSASPSGSGVVAVADGRTTTRGASTTRQETGPDATDVPDGDNDDVVALWTGGASSVLKHADFWTLAGLHALAVLMGLVVL